MTQFTPLSAAVVSGKRVLLRAGFDVPVEEGVVTDTQRIEALVPTMRWIIEQGGRLVILAHQGRPKGKPDPAFSQKPLVPVLSELLGRPVGFSETVSGTKAEQMTRELKDGDVLLVENLRYDPREEANDPVFAKELAALGDLYVNDAFTNCHRAHASMVGVPALLPAFAGLNLTEELKYLSPIVDSPKHPLVLVISGAKMETKVPVIEQFLARADAVLVGGAIANTLLAAQGFDVGVSKYEPDFIETADRVLLESEKEGRARVHTPMDVVVASSPEATATLDVPVEDVETDMAIFDLGPGTIADYIQVIEKAAMIVWNGPLGLYEQPTFMKSTRAIADAIAAATAKGAVSIIGGGDTIDFHERAHLPLSRYTFVSTGGGAMLEFLAGKPLPALTALAGR